MSELRDLRRAIAANFSSPPRRAKWPTHLSRRPARPSSSRSRARSSAAASAPSPRSSPSSRRRRRTAHRGAVHARDAERLLDGLLGLVRTSVKNDVRASEHSTLLLLNDALAQAARGGAGVGRPGAAPTARCCRRSTSGTRDGAQPLRPRMAEKKAAFVAPS